LSDSPTTIAPLRLGRRPRAVTAGANDDAIDDIVRRYRAGDELAFAELYLRLFDRVRRYLVAVLQNAEEAQDGAQQVFVKVLEHFPREPLREPFRAWIFRVAHNHAVDLQRKARRVETTDPDEVDRRRDDAARRAPGPFEGSGDADVGEMVRGLPRIQQRVIVLRFVYEFTTAETAEVLERSADSVRHIQMRALATLASDLPLDLDLR
jgi:RNA polymerase sigma-70 factor (ECF subfamily)